MFGMRTDRERLLTIIIRAIDREVPQVVLLPDRISERSFPIDRGKAHKPRLKGAQRQGAIPHGRKR